MKIKNLEKELKKGDLVCCIWRNKFMLGRILQDQSRKAYKIYKIEEYIKSIFYTDTGVVYCEEYLFNETTFLTDIDMRVGLHRIGRLIDWINDGL